MANRLLGRRAAAAIHSAQRRPLLSGPRQSNVLSHSHIRNVPHTENSSAFRNEEELVDETPTFRSTSVQFRSSEYSIRFIEDSRENSSNQVQTFTDMARRSHRSDNEVGKHQLTPVSIPQTGVVKLQPNRRNMTGPWRRMPKNESRECEDGDEASKYSSYHVDTLHPSGTITATSSEPASIQFKLPSSAPTLAENQKPSSVKHLSLFRTSLEVSVAEGNRSASFGINLNEDDRYEYLFGKLPDPIHLHEHTGQFDGQVVFIAHPSRDISAHQWSSASFQWINIGRYAHYRGIVEGSLASDCSKEYAVSENPLYFFKSAAENRQNLVREKGRRKDSPEVLRTSHCDGEISKDSQLNTLLETDNTLKEDYLDDPFVVPHVEFDSPTTSRAHSSTIKVETRGSMDFEYGFLFKSIISPKWDYNVDSNALDMRLGIKKTFDEELYCNSILPNRLSQLALQDVALGEDAASGSATPYARDFVLPRDTTASSLEAVRYHRDFRNEQMELCGGEHLNPRRAESTVQSLSPLLGLTVASPDRIVSNLNAAAPPYSNVQIPAPGFELTNHNATNVYNATITWRHSDPDNAKPVQEYEIANGVSKQPPTKQNFKGSFFDSSKPSAIDPAVSLSVSINEEEKLLNWFSDGHRASRQQEYAKTLMSATGPVNQNRRPSIIGDVETRRGQGYENTPMFVRLYQCLSEYVEEPRSAVERSYFTRVWKHAPLVLKDPSPDGNNSFLTHAINIVSGSCTSSVQAAWESADFVWDLGGSSPFEYWRRFY